MSVDKSKDKRELITDSSHNVKVKLTPKEESPEQEKIRELTKRVDDLQTEIKKIKTDLE